MEKLKSTTFHISYGSTMVGAVVTAVVYSTILISGEVVSSATSAGIQLTGSFLGYSTEVLLGTQTGDLLRSMAKAYSGMAKPAISTTYRLAAIAISVVAGAGAAVTTSLFTYTGRKVGTYVFAALKDYNEQLVNKDRYLIPLKETRRGTDNIVPEEIRKEKPFELISPNALLEKKVVTMKEDKLDKLLLLQDLPFLLLKDTSKKQN